MHSYVDRDGVHGEFSFYYAERLDEIKYPDEGNTMSKEQNFSQDVENVYLQAMELMLKKHADYGPDNIAQSPFGALNGLVVRMWDKFARVKHLMVNGAEPQNESLRDTFVDIANYSLIALLVLDNKWPGAENDK